MPEIDAVSVWPGGITNVCLSMGRERTDAYGQIGDADCLETRMVAFVAEGSPLIPL